jgi:hypothetical protein
VRNAARLPPYQRADLRVERDFLLHNRRLAVFGELLNLSGHVNERYFTTALRFDPSTGAVLQSPETLLPRVAGFGVRFDY